jgi:hypothetical protein
VEQVQAVAHPDGVVAGPGGLSISQHDSLPFVAAQRQLTVLRGLTARVTHE